jgi:hypothetical protein
MPLCRPRVMPSAQARRPSYMTPQCRYPRPPPARTVMWIDRNKEKACSAMRSFSQRWTGAALSPAASQCATLSVLTSKEKRQGIADNCLRPSPAPPPKPISTCPPPLKSPKNYHRIRVVLRRGSPSILFGDGNPAFAADPPSRALSEVARRGLPWLTACEGHRMDRDLGEKARDDRLKALAKLSYRQSAEPNVRSLVSRSAEPQPGTVDDLRRVFREPAAFDPPAPLASGPGVKRPRSV